MARKNKTQEDYLQRKQKCDTPHSVTERFFVISRVYTMGRFAFLGLPGGQTYRFVLEKRSRWGYGFSSGSALSYDHSKAIPNNERIRNETMMKKRIAIFAALLVCLCMVTALSSDYSPHDDSEQVTMQDSGEGETIVPQSYPPDKDNF